MSETKDSFEKEKIPPEAWERSAIDDAIVKGAKSQRFSGESFDSDCGQSWETKRVGKISVNPPRFHQRCRISRLFWCHDLLRGWWSQPSCAMRMHGPPLLTFFPALGHLADIAMIMVLCASVSSSKFICAKASSQAVLVQGVQHVLVSLLLEVRDFVSTEYVLPFDQRHSTSAIFAFAATPVSYLFFLFGQIEHEGQRLVCIIMPASHSCLKFFRAVTHS